MSEAKVISLKGELLARKPCALHCSDCDELTGMPIMVCKHCDAQREMTDDDFDT